MEGKGREWRVEERMWVEEKEVNSAQFLSVVKEWMRQGIQMCR